MKRRTFLLVACALVLGGSLALFFAWQRRQNDRAARQIEARNASHAADYLRLKDSLAATAREKAKLDADLKTIALASAKAPSKSDSRSPGKPPNFQHLLQENPKLQAMYLRAKKAEFAVSYGPLFRSLNLSASQESEASLRALLGNQGYAAETEYARTVPVRTLVNNIAGTLAFSDPLTPQQGEQLTQAIANASPPYQGGGRADWAQVDWAQVDGAAQSFLSPAQLALWQSAEPMGGGPSRWMSVLSAKIQAAQSGAVASAPPKP